ncbi:MAG: hypothetical protein PHO63_03890 [Bacilli bacterium]|nr:hypothetical protein [Bacilli bacterium]MDD4808575.1 hypothetical protein [Bacilli bacterium]
MGDLIFAIIVFIIIYLLYLGIVILNKEKLEKFTKAKEISLLVSKYKLDLKQINIKKLVNMVALSNSFIMALAIYLVSLVENIFLQILVAFVVIFPSILIIYPLIGNYFKKKEVKKNV